MLIERITAICQSSLADMQAFPERRLAGGRRVGTLAELEEYLAAADPAIRVAELPLEGRNRVVYCTAWS